MVCACLVASVLSGNYKDLESEEVRSPFEIIEGVSEEEAYLNGKNSLHSNPYGGYYGGYALCAASGLIWIAVGEYKIILQLVGLLSHGKLSKGIADRAINAMEDVQNLRRAVYE